MSDPRPAGGDASIPSAPLRPLPAHPSLEFERKRAKKLLREMRRTNPEAKLADAQFAAAREYGFSSWPRLVDYFTTLDRHEKSAPPPAWYPLEQFEREAEQLLKRHQNRRHSTAASLAMFIPRFYGRRLEEVALSPITIDDAHLVIARTNRLPSWEAFVDWVNSEAPQHRQGWNQNDSPGMRALAAIRAHDVDALGRHVDAHPELLQPTGRWDRGGASSALHSALIHEFRTRTGEARSMVDYLVSRGGDLTRALNYILYSFIGRGHAPNEDRGERMIDFLMERGADPTWIPENGFTVLEHMLMRQRSREDIDLVLRYVTPRKAFWIAAGIGDAKSLAGYFDKNGKLREEARKHRPDFTALGPFSMPSLPDVDDIDIIGEGFMVALMNERYESMDVLLDRGFPVDYSFWGSTAFSYALNSRNVKLIEYLVQRGARADMEGATPEQIDEWFFEADPTSADSRRIYELCGGRNADAVLRRYEARQQQPPTLAPQLVRVLEFARDDAAILGQTEVRDENLFVGLFRDDSRLPITFLSVSGVDIARFRKSIEHRIARGTEVSPNGLPMGAEAQTTIDAAIARRMKEHWRVLTSLDVLLALVRHDTGPIADMLVAAGGKLGKLRESLARAAYPATS